MNAEGRRDGCSAGVPDFAVAARRQDRLMSVVVADDEERSLFAAADVDDFSRALDRTDHATMDHHAVAYLCSHADHLLALTIRRARRRR
jgi:hypothetical protein